MKNKAIGFFERFLTLWVFLCIGIGISIGHFLPSIPTFLNKLEYANVSIPISILIWLMIFPMMLKIDFSSIKNAFTQPKGIIITLIINWILKPAMMFFLSIFFFKVVFSNQISKTTAIEYVAGAVLLGAAPCTAMVFVWSHLTKGDPAYTILQVALNDLIILFAFIPIISFYLGISDIKIPYPTLLFSILIFIVAPLLIAIWVRTLTIKKKGLSFLNDRLLPFFNKITIPGLLLTLITIFAFQGDKIIENPLNIAMISIPLTLETFCVFFIGWILSLLFKVPYSIAAPSALIGASNFFELAVAVAITLFGMESGATLVTVVGVLVEVPVMLSLVWIMKKSRFLFKEASNL